MKSDRKLLLAVIILMSLVLVLIFITLRKEDAVDRAVKEIKEMQIVTDPKPMKAVDGRTPVLGQDYFNGKDGQDGKQGEPGASAYDIAVKNGFKGNEQQWLASLKGKDGKDGKGIKGDKGDKGDAADEIELDCLVGIVMKKRITDDFWQPTTIKCEVSHG